LGRVGNYQLQAAIAAVHAEALDSFETDWRQIVALYGELKRINPSSIVALNHAVAVAMDDGFERGLALIDEAGASGKLDNYFSFHSSRADLLRRLGRVGEATAAYKRALSLTGNEVERRFLRKRLHEIGCFT
jgi:RNA polymerase sigma-70 factor (ECF subfamily)